MAAAVAEVARPADLRRTGERAEGRAREGPSGGLYDNGDLDADSDLSAFAQQLSQLAAMAEVNPRLFSSIVYVISNQLVSTSAMATTDDRRVLIEVANQFARAAADRSLARFHVPMMSNPSRARAAGAGAYRQASNDNMRAVITRIVRRAIENG